MIDKRIAEIFSFELKQENVPMIIMQNNLVMPGATVSIDIRNKISVKAVKTAMEKGDGLFIVRLKKQPTGDAIKKEELHQIGVLVRVKQILKLGDGEIRVLLTSASRARLHDFVFEDDYYKANIESVTEAYDTLSDVDREAYLRSLQSVIKECQDRRMVTSKVTTLNLLNVIDLEILVDLMAEAVSIPISSKQEILDESNLKNRIEILLAALINEISINDIRVELGNKLKDCVNKNQREYVMREQLKVIRDELGENSAENEADNYRNRVAMINPPEEVKEKLEKEIKRFSCLSYSSSESAVLRNYIETLLDYPWCVEGEDNNDLKKAIKQLEEDHYGLVKIKERIVDYLAVRILSGRRDAPILCLVGPPGTGKTSIAKSVAAALHKKYGRIALGGVRDEAEIRGHRKTYIGAMPGRIVTALTKTGVNNPVLLLDEIDKTSSDYKGDVSSALLEVLDGEQNVHFTDHYFEVPVDLSNVLFIATANDASDIPAPLRDRMEIIEVNSYTENEKYHIAKLYLLDKQLQKNGLNKRQFKITDEAIYKLIRCYTKEAGVRALERTMSLLMQKTARGIVTGEFKSVTVNPKRLVTMLGTEKYSDDKKELKNEVGVVNGLAWTKVGGDTLKVEVNILDGKESLTLTGNLGDVMKESAQIALSYIRTLPEIKKLPDEYFEKHTVHVHVPEGATPKDGPSAGITMALAIYSALMNRPVDGSLAMTGEITLKGQVLPIGGLKEKLLAAKNAGMKRVLVPLENKKKVLELEKEITEGMEILFVSTMSEVISYGIVKRTFALKQ